MRLKLTLSQTANNDGKTYLQIISDDSFSVNVVLLSDGVEVNDMRPEHLRVAEPVPLSIPVSIPKLGISGAAPVISSTVVTTTAKKLVMRTAASNRKTKKK